MCCLGYAVWVRLIGLLRLLVTRGMKEVTNVSCTKGQVKINKCQTRKSIRNLQI